MRFVFESPHLLIGTAIALVILLSVLFWKRGTQIFRRGNIWYVTSLLMLVICFGTPLLNRPEYRSEAYVAVDLSESMEQSIGETLLQKVEEFQHSEFQLRLFPFSKMPGVMLDMGSSYDQLRRSWGKLDLGGTDLCRTLQSLPAPSGSKVLLITDGFQTIGSGESCFSALAKRNLRIFPILPSQTNREKQGVRISNMVAPLVAPQQKGVPIRTSIRNSTNESKYGTLRIRQGEKVLFDKQVEIPASEESVLLTTSDPSFEGIHEITSSFVPADRNFTPSEGKIFLSGVPREKILVINGEREDARFLGEALKSQAYQTTQVIASEGKETQDFSEFSTVIVNNAPYQYFGRERAQQLRRYVEDGGGLIMIGGGKSFGLGGYVDTDIEKVLPVEMLPPRTTLKRLNIAVQLVLDKSRSMADNDKIAFAREASKEVVRNLKDDDYLGVIGFDSNPFIVQRVELLSQIRDTVMSRIDILFPARRTNLLPAIDEARRGLERIPAGRKHIIILTDGKLPDGGPYYVELVRELRSLGMTVSTVLLSDEVDEVLLRDMAQAGGGAFYQTADAGSLPRIFVKDIKVSGGEKTAQEASELFVRRGPAPLSSTSLTSFPSLRGYVEVKPKEGANLELVIAGTEKAEPLLTSGKFGKGKSIAFTSDANGRWSSAWISWPKFHAFWSDLVDATRSNDGVQNKNIPFDLKWFMENGELQLDLSIYSKENLNGVKAKVRTPNGETRSLDFRSASPGRFLASLDQVLAGKHEVELRVGSLDLPPVAFYLSGELFGEKKGQGFNVAFLEQLASKSGGKLNPTRSDLTDEPTVIPHQTDLRPLGFALAMLLMLVGVIRREGWGS